MNKVIETDVLIIGSGLAGLLAAIQLLQSGTNVVLACKTGLAESNSRYAQGGIAAAAPSEGTAATASKAAAVIPIKDHLADTIKAGAGLVDEKAAEEIVSNGWRLIELLSRYGVVFDHRPDGGYSLVREGGHSTARVYHHQDVTGTWICNALISQLMTLKNLQIFQHTFAVDLLMSDGKCVGSHLVTEKDTITVVAAHTILATGGIGQVFSRTTNPAIATGDGIAMAYNAGADLIDMEFVQFHPTALHLENVSDLPTMLISEAVRGAGAILLDHNRQEFMQRFDPGGALATRDVVSRSMCQVMTESGSDHLFLDLRPIGVQVLQQNFPNILQQLNHYGINALEEPVPVSPAAHYFMGGINADCNGKTSIPFLYAIGECASTGLHGANRLASNSLLEAGVMAFKVAEFINEGKTNSPAAERYKNDTGLLSSVTIPSDLRALRKLMFAKAGIIRSAQSLEALFDELKRISTTADYSIANAEKANALLVAKLITESALRRQESRGAHYRSDYPQLSDKFAARQILNKNNSCRWLGNKNLCPSN